jgi:hypothetical protein
MSDNSPARPWYNNCNFSGSMSDAKWEGVKDKFYASFPITDEKVEWELLFSKEQKEKEERHERERLNMLKRRKKFKIKPKKDTSQTKMKAFFAQKTNKDGYPMHHCRYHPELKEHIYVPPGYGRPCIRGIKPALFEAFCHHCMLAPCVTEHYHYDASQYAIDMTKDLKVDVPNSVLRAGTAVFLQKKHCKLFKQRYSKKMPVLTCINEHVSFWSHGCDPSSDEESDDGCDPSSDEESNDSEQEAEL